MERLLFAPRALPPLRPDVAEDPSTYSVEALQAERSNLSIPSVDPGDGPDLTFLMPIAGEPEQTVVRSLQGLAQQSSSRWELVIVLENTWRTALTAMLAVSGVRRSSQRVRIVGVPVGTSLPTMIDSAIKGQPGNLSLLFAGDVLTRNAVARLRALLKPGGVVYADEDRIHPGSGWCDPVLKPAYSPEFLLRSFYVGRPVAFSAEVLGRTAPASLTANFEHDLVLRACEVADHVDHIPEVLCHRSDVSVDVHHAEDVRHVQAALTRRGETTTEIRSGPHGGPLRIIRHPAAAPSVSIIIPFRDQPTFLRACIESIDATRGSQCPELILVDNGSSQPETASLMDRMLQRDDVTLLRDDRPFNWAALNNLAAASATGDVLLFLNNDIEALTKGWIEALCSQAMREGVGAVGSRLLYPDGRVQHCGVVVGLGGAAGHLLAGLGGDKPGYLNMAVTTRECSAVTGACLATRHAVFDALQGFDESLGVDLNDIDYCLRAQRTGLHIIYEPEAELIHHESPSRGTAGDVGDIVHFIDRWEQSLLKGDPFLNPLLTRKDSSCALREGDEASWWKQWRANLSRTQ